MGKWFARFFRDRGHEVGIYDVRGASPEFESYGTLREGIEGKTCALIATSLDTVQEVIDELRALSFGGVVFDIASFKSHLKDSIGRAAEGGISITSIHPMYGPTAGSLSGKVICFCDCGCAGANGMVESFFVDTPASRVTVSLDEHDRIVSYVLGLSHMINILFATVLREGGFSRADLEAIGSVTFFSQMVTTSNVMKNNHDLYYSIQKLNPHGKELYECLIDTIERVTDLVLSGNETGFLEIMKRGKAWLEQEAYEAGEKG